MSNDELFSTEEAHSVEWRHRLYFKPSTLNALPKAAASTVRTVEQFVVWCVEQQLAAIRGEGRLNPNDK